MRSVVRGLRAAAAGLLITLLPAGCDLLTRITPFPSLNGRIVWPKGGELAVLRLSDHEETRLATLTTPSDVITGASWSPDGSRVVYAHFSRRESARISGSDLLVVDSEGGAPSVLVDRGEAATVLDAPAWTRSGWVYYSVSTQAAGAEGRRIMRRRAEGGQPEVVATGAFGPSVFEDESALLYSVGGPGAPSLWKQSLDGGARCLLVPASTFAQISGYAAAPDGSRIAFIAAGEPGDSSAGSCGASAAAPARSIHRVLLGLGVLPSVAHAHGVPADLWVINPDGSGLRRVARLQEDEAQLAWSPDGRVIAVFGLHGLYAVDPATGRQEVLEETNGYGAPDWFP